MNEHLLSILNNIQKPESTSKDDRVLLIDGLNMFIRVFSVVPVISDNGHHIGGILGFLKSVAMNIRDFNATRCVIVFDGKGGSQRRREIFPEYKMNRTGNRFGVVRMDGCEMSAEEEQESMRHQLSRILHYLDCLPVQIICIDRIEADDVIAYATMQYFIESKTIRILSTDRDYLQLVSDRIEVYSPTKKVLYTPETIRQEFGVYHENYLLHRLFTGDGSDNIPGVKGVGVKTLVKHFPEILEKGCNYEEILLSSKEKIDGKNSRIFKIIHEHESVLRRNHQLMQLDDVNISGNSKMNIIGKLNSPIPSLNKPEFKRLMVDDYLQASFKDIDIWLYNSFNRLNIWATH